MPTLLVVEIKDLALKTKLNAAEIIEDALRRITAERWIVLFGQAKVENRLPVELPEEVITFMKYWNSGNWPLTKTFVFNLHLPIGYLKSTSSPASPEQNTMGPPTMFPTGVPKQITDAPKKAVVWEEQDSYRHL